MPPKPPHYGVYTRVVCSKIHGVGVIAIRPIRKRTPIFAGDDERLRWISKSTVKRLPKEIRRLYADFCIDKGEFYGCPSNFNRLTPAWYLNHSSSPNVTADSSYRFYALRDIRKNEELTVDYGTYSEVRRRRLR
jgi:hypothetical protein